jgi:GR25 family glycosyltransferase involved in LPS biosynthesis
MFYDHIAIITTKNDPAFHKTKREYIAGRIGVDASDIKVHFFKRHPGGPDIGCFTSHLAIWRYIAEHKFENTLVFEDDVVFLKSIDSDDFEPFLAKHPDWEIFYFGHRPVIWQPRLVQKTESRGIVEVRTNDTHAYVVNLRTAEKLAKLEWYGKPVDISLRENTTKSYAFFPMRAIQCGRFFTDSFFNGMSERNSQYIRYALQKPLNIFRAVGFLTFMVLAQPWIFLSSTWMCFTKPVP